MTARTHDVWHKSDVCQDGRLVLVCGTSLPGVPFVITPLWILSFPANAVQVGDSRR